MPENLLIQLWKQASSDEVEQAIGLKIGMKVNQQAKGVLANWLSQCASLSEAFDIFSKNIALLNPSEQWTKVVTDGQVRLSLQFTSNFYPSLAIDRSMAAMISWSQALSEQTLVPISIEFNRSAPTSLIEYVNYFGESIAFDRPENCIVISEDSFNTNIKSANPYLKELISKQAAEIYQAISISSTTTEAVNKLLTEDLAFYCHISTTCEALHTSRSTLFRKLKAENTTFSLLVKEARLLVINQQKNSLRSDEVLTELLGFQDINSYYRFQKSNAHNNEK